MIEKKKVLRNSVRIAILFLFMMISVFSFNVYADESASLSQDDKGNYLIKTEEDFHTFIDLAGTRTDRFKNEKVILCNDLIIETPNNCPSNYYGYFAGTFDGKGHTIEYKSGTLQNYTAQNSVFPFTLTGGTLKNVKVNADQCNIEAYFSDQSFPDVPLLVIAAIDESTIEGVEFTANTIISIGGDEFRGTGIGAFECSGNSSIKDSSVSINYELSDNTDIDELINKIENAKKRYSDLALFQFGLGASSFDCTFTSCYSKGTYGPKLIKLAEERNKANVANKRAGIIAQFMGGSSGFNLTNCYYDETREPQLYAICEFNKRFYQTFDKETYGRTTEQMKQQSTYEGFDFDQKWSISSDVNEGYPYYNLRTEEVVLKARPLVADKEWNTTSTKDKNKYGRTDTYYYPYCGDDNGTVTGVEFTDLTAEQQAYVEKYGISLNYDLEKDIESAKIDMNFLGVRPVQVTWKNQPTLTIANSDQAEDDGYEFSVEMVDGTANVTEMKGTENGIPEDQWDAYYAKAKEAIQVIMTYCEKNDNFGPKDSPSYENTNVWAIFTAARCGYVPYGDSTYFARWFANTEKYLQSLKDSGTDFTETYRVTDIAKLALAVEAIGYDIRDISSVDLLTALGTVKDMDEGLMYKYEYMIHAIKAAGYSSTSETFTDEDIKNWAIKCADGLKNAEDSAFVNADNSMGWQPLIYWYDDPDVKAAIDSAEKRYPIIGQRATGAFCTYGYETGCPTYGNNAWNNAQALFFASEFDVNILDYAAGYTKNGNNILDAVFDQINFEDTSYTESTLPGFFSYDPPQIARGLCSFVRSYERNIKNKDVPAFWVFSDVPVPTRKVNDLILALDDNSTKAQITAARIAYDALDDAHKAIFNKDTLKKLLDAEGKGELIEKAVKAIDSIPAADQLTLEDKKTVEKARTLYDALDAESQAAVSNYSKLTEAEAKIAELEEKQAQETADRKAAESVSTAIASLPTAENLIPNDYVLKRLDEVQAAYDALTETQKALVENYETLQTLRTVAADKKAAAEVTEKINAIGTLNAGNHEQKQALVTEARTAYDALSDIQKGYVANYGVLEKAELFLSTCEKDKQAAYVMSVIDELNTVSKNMADGPLKLTEKNNGVPTEEIWKDWEDYVVNARAQYAALDAVQQEQVENLSDLEAAEGYVYQVKAEALKEQLEVLPDAATVKGYEAQPTETPVETPEEITAETSVAEFDSDVFSDESADIFSTDTTEETQEADFAEMQDTAENDTPSADLRALTDEELTMITAAKNAYEQLTAAEEEKFRTENAALVENMEQLITLALTYPNGQESYQQQFAAEAAQLYAAVNPVSRDTYAAVKVLLDRYEKEYQPYAEAMAALKVEVNGQEMTFADVITALKEQTAKAEKDIADAAEADQWILSIPTAVTKDNIHEVEADLASLQKYMDSMSEEARSYMWQNAQLALVRTIVADYHVELADKKDTFKASSPQNLKTKVLNYKTIQVSWTGTDYADSYNVYRKTGSGNWKKIASGITGVSYKDTKAVTGITYSYTVRAVSYTWGKAVLSSYDRSGVRGKAKLTAVSLTSVKNAGKNTVKVSWKKVTGANGYRVYRSTSKNGEYTSAGFIKKGSTVTFKDKKVSEGKTYYYKIRAYRTVNGKRVYGPYSAVKSVKAK